MINAIAGKNASGKTLCLRRGLEDTVRNNKSVVTNFRNLTMYERNYCKASIQLINEVYKNEIEFALSDGMVEGVNNSIELSQKYLQMLQYVCLESEFLILDEPESGLYSAEIEKLAEILFRLSKIKTVWITTHEPSFCSGLIANTFIVNEDGKLSRR